MVTAIGVGYVNGMDTAGEDGMSDDLIDADLAHAVTEQRLRIRRRLRRSVHSDRDPGGGLALRRQ